MANEAAENTAQHPEHYLASLYVEKTTLPQ
jgi:hypothetical protein